MKKLILSFFLIFSSTTISAEFYYSDYAELRDNFEESKKLINKEINEANRGYINSLNSYQSCKSNRWRVMFTSVVPEIDRRRLALEEFKRNALKRTGHLNSEWLKTAGEHGISKVLPRDDISDFYYWYQGHIELSRLGPLDELEVYVKAISKLTGTYEKMALACSGDPTAIYSYDLAESGIRGLLDEVFSLIGKISVSHSNN